MTAAVRSQLAYRSAIVRPTCQSSRTHSSPVSRSNSGTPQGSTGAPYGCTAAARLPAQPASVEVDHTDRRHVEQIVGIGDAAVAQVCVLLEPLSPLILHCGEQAAGEGEADQEEDRRSARRAAEVAPG